MTLIKSALGNHPGFAGDHHISRLVGASQGPQHSVNGNWQPGISQGLGVSFLFKKAPKHQPACGQASHRRNCEKTTGETSPAITEECWGLHGLPLHFQHSHHNQSRMQQKCSFLHRTFCCRKKRPFLEEKYPCLEIWDGISLGVLAGPSHGAAQPGWHTALPTHSPRIQS